MKYRIPKTSTYSEVKFRECDYVSDYQLIPSIHKKTAGSDFDIDINK